MKRRDFLKTSAQAALAGAAAAASVRPVSAAEGDAGEAHAASILKSYSAEDHRRRLQNIGVCERGIRSSMRKHLVADYLPGQCCYNLGEYPCRKPWDPGEYDERELDRLKEHGIQLIQVFDEWNDSLRLLGGDKFTA
ncbi:MAG: twin-arginine translocation signal domain-containing protein, partial [Planctomycetota bacterium]